MTYENNDKLNSNPPTDQNADPNLAFTQAKSEVSANSPTTDHPTNILNTPNVFSRQNPILDEPPFQSRFKGWIRSVALTLLVVFIPDQISWAINYDPSVLWNKLPNVQVVNTNLPPAAASSMQITQSVQNLLGQIANKPNTRLQLQIDEPSPVSKGRQLIVDSNTLFTPERIGAITQWLSKPEIHPLNCSIYSLNDILVSRGFKPTLEEISVLTLTVDLMNNIIKPGDPKLKTSLLAMEKVAEAYELNYKAIKIKPQDVFKLTTPFVANFSSEHFVTVTRIEGDTVHFIDIGQPDSLSKEQFVNQLTGYVLAPHVDELSRGTYEEITNTAKAFVWGSRWRDNSKNLPGLMSNSQILTQIGINAIMLYIGSFGPGGLAFASFSMGASAFAGQVAEACVVKGKCNAKQAFVLSTALTMAIVAMGGSFLPPENVAGATAENAAKNAGTSAATTAANQSLWDSIRTTMSKIGSTIYETIDVITKPVTGAIKSFMESRFWPPGQGAVNAN